MPSFFRAAVHCLGLVFLLSFATLSTAAKPRVVLLPVSVSEQDASFEDEFGAALQQGLQGRYEVYYGAAVEKQLEREYQKANCTPETCAQNVAIAFQGELVGDASVSRVGNGYALKLVIRNVLTGKAVETRTQTCRDCDALQVIEQLKQMTASSSLQQTSALVPLDGAVEKNKPQESAAIFIFDTVPTGMAVSINGKAAGVTPYQGLQHSFGEKLIVEVNDPYFLPYRAEVKLEVEVTRPEAVVLQRGEGQLLVAVDPFEENAKVLVDGKEKGVAPLRLTLLAGKHDVAIRTANNQEKSASVDLRSGDNKQQVFALKAQSKGGSLSSSQGNLANHYTKIGVYGEELPENSKKWSCVLDKKTGLMWKAVSNGRKFTWREAFESGGFVDQVNQNGLCGFRDWRGAKNEDLVSLLTCNYPDCKGEGPHIERNFFPYTGRFYWSFSLYDADVGNAWVIDFGSGHRDTYDKHNAFYVHLVRDETIAKKGMRYTKIAADGAALPDDAAEWTCVLDNEAGFMWEAKTDDGGLHDKDNNLTWYKVFDAGGVVDKVNNEGLCGYQDWRGPNKEELVGLLACGSPNCKGSGTLNNKQYFPYTGNAGEKGAYWSASQHTGLYDAESYLAFVVNYLPDYPRNSARVRSLYGIGGVCKAAEVNRCSITARSNRRLKR